MNITKSRSVIITTWEVQVEEVDRAEFQKAGHFVAGHVTGDRVCVMNLISPDGIQVLRVQGNTLDECDETMTRELPLCMWTMAKAKAIQGMDYDAFLAIKSELGRLAGYIQMNYGEDEHATNTVSTAIRYMRVERGRMSVRFGKWLRRFLGTYPDQPRVKGEEDENAGS